SRTSAGIKEIDGEYWVFNLSSSNRTVLNGELVDKTPLADGDVLQIGRYILRLNYKEDALAITVEMEPEAQVQDARAGIPATELPPAEQAGQATQLLQQVPARPITSGTQQLKGTGLLTGVMAPQAAQALNVF